jgi:2,3-bisphosphoglycerate-dependent phosphoglycerate mutase
MCAATLVLLRHGESLWNDAGRWTGLMDIPLSATGRAEAQQAARQLTGRSIDVAFTSMLQRAAETLTLVLAALDQRAVPVVQAAALNERDYGRFTGKSKAALKAELGDAAFRQLHRGWATPTPGGESVQDVYQRVVPFYEAAIVRELQQGKQVLVVAHGTSLRVLVKYIEQLSDTAISNVELSTGQAITYTADQLGCTLIARPRE